MGLIDLMYLSINEILLIIIIYDFNLAHIAIFFYLALLMDNLLLTSSDNGDDRNNSYIVFFRWPLPFFCYQPYAVWLLLGRTHTKTLLYAHFFIHHSDVVFFFFTCNRNTLVKLALYTAREWNNNCSLFLAHVSPSAFRNHLIQFYHR